MDWVITHRQTATAGRLVATSAFKVWLSRGAVCRGAPAPRRASAVDRLDRRIVVAASHDQHGRQRLDQRSKPLVEVQIAAHQSGRSSAVASGLFATLATATNVPISHADGSKAARPETLPCVVTFRAGGQVPAGRVRLHHVERGSSAAARARLSRWQADREMGSGQSETDERLSDSAYSGADQRAGG